MTGERLRALMVAGLEQYPPYAEHKSIHKDLCSAKAQHPLKPVTVRARALFRCVLRMICKKEGDFMNLNIKKQYMILAGVIVVILLVIASVWLLRSRTNNEPMKITTVTQTTPNGLKTYFPDMSNSEAKDVSRRIETVKENSAPTYHYVTYTQTAADEKAQELATVQKADKVVKTTTIVPVEAGKDETVNSPKPSVYENNYYAINMERKHKIAAGVMSVDGKAYAAVSYTNRDVTATAYTDDFRGINGGSVMYTVAKW